MNLPIPNVFGLKGVLIGCAVSVVLGGAGGAYLGYKFEHGRYVELQLADAKAMQAAILDAKDKQHRIDLGNQEDAVAEAYFRGKMDGTIVNLKSGAPLNVTITQDQQAAAADHAGCITYGFYRMLVAGERIVPADSLDIPDGQSVDACTALVPSELATALAQDLADGTANGHQLNGLIAAVKRNDAIVGGHPTPGSP